MSQQNTPHGPGRQPRRPLFDQDAQHAAAGRSGDSEPYRRDSGRAGAPYGDAPRAGAPRQVYRSGSAGRPAGDGRTGSRSAAGGYTDRDMPRATRRPEGGRGDGRRPAGVHTSAVTRERMLRKKRRRRRAAIISLTAVLVIIGLLAGGVYAVYRWFDERVQNENTPSIPEEVQAQNFPEYHGNDVVYGLICGIDKEKDANGNIIDPIGRTDLIMYLKFNTKTGECNFLQIPRDTFVGEALNTGGEYKINNLYFHAEDPSQRIKPLAEMLYDQFKLPLDFYITLDVDAVVALVDSIGGIEVYVPHDLVNVDQVTGRETVMRQGWHTLIGEDTEFFLRHRQSFADQDISRLKLQQNFYAALFKQLKQLSAGDLMTWMKIILHYATIGGLDTLEIMGLGLKALNIKGEDITFVRPAGNGVVYNGKWVFALIKEDLAEVLNQYFRPEGHVVPAEELNVYELPMDPSVGTSELSVRTMGDIQEGEAPKAA